MCVFEMRGKMGINFVDRCRSITKEGDHVVPRSSVMKSLKSKVQWDPDALPCIVMLLNKQGLIACKLVDSQPLKNT